MSDDNEMTGQNTLTLNAATMVKAIQYWLNECIFMCDCGVEVKTIQAADCSTASAFKVSFEPPKPDKK